MALIYLQEINLINTLYMYLIVRVKIQLISVQILIALIRYYLYH